MLPEKNSRRVVRPFVSPYVRTSRIRVRPITSEVGFFLTISQKCSPYWDDVTRATFALLPWRSMSQHGLTAKSCPAHNFVIWSPIYTLLTGMITISRRRVARNIWVAILKAKVTAWPCSKIVSDPDLCYLKSDFTTILTNYFSVSNTYSGSITCSCCYIFPDLER